MHFWIGVTVLYLLFTIVNFTMSKLISLVERKLSKKKRVRWSFKGKTEQHDVHENVLILVCKDGDTRYIINTQTFDSAIALLENGLSYAKKNKEFSLKLEQIVAVK